MVHKSERPVVIRLLVVIFALVAWLAGYLWYSHVYTKSIAYRLKRLESDDEIERMMAVLQLGTHPEEADQVVPALASCLSDPDRHVRTAAAWSLDRMGPRARDAAPALVEAVSRAGIPPSGRIGEEEGRYLMFLSSVIGKIGATPETVQALPQMARHLKSEDSLVTWSAASALTAIGRQSKEAFPTLAAVVKDESVSFGARLRIAESIADMGVRYPELAPQVAILQTELNESNAFLAKRLSASKP